jgi:hypothetical protein
LKISKLSFTCLQVCAHACISMMSLCCFQIEYAFAAGGGNESPSGAGALQPLSPNNGGFSFSQQVQGFGSFGSSCGLQLYGSINSGKVNTPYSVNATLESAPSSGYNANLGFVLNGQRCINPNAQMQHQTQQTLIQVCGPMRAQLVLKEPTTTKERLDEVCPLKLKE